MCVDVNSNTASNGNAVQLWTCNAAQGQQWTLERDHTIRSFGKCLDIAGDGTANSARVQLWRCNGAGGQQWMPTSDGGLLNPQSGRCLDAPPQGRTVKGTRLQIYDCDHLLAQQWNTPTPP
jgi:hypothetical protein